MATARPPSEIAPLSPDAFRPIILAPDPTAAVPEANDTIATGPEPSRGPIADFPVASWIPSLRPNPTLPMIAKAEVKVQPKPQGKPHVKKATRALKLTGRHATGTATWYCKTGVSVCHHSYPGGMYAAAGSELRIGAWRGRYVRVCAGSDCIRVRLIDWCACGGNHIIDLYSDAFRQLAPLSAGGIHVTVSW
jgi:hypothetical protein